MDVVTAEQLESLVAAAKQLAVDRWGVAGWSGAAAILTASGSILTSVFVEAPNDAATLCHETGAICEAHKLNEKVVASVCVSREKANEEFEILTPCGICQERLAYWGMDVLVAVPTEGKRSVAAWRRLRDVQPYYWAK